VSHASERKNLELGLMAEPVALAGCCADPGRSNDPMRHPGAVGRQSASFLGSSSDYRFSWFCTGSGGLAIFVGDARVDGEPRLAFVRAVGRRLPGGWLVAEPDWDAYVTPDGDLAPQLRNLA
jgi:hypothetical protein